MCAICAEGAPSLRPLQGWAAMLLTQPFVPSAEGQLRLGSRLPPFADCAKDGAPLVLRHANGIKSLGNPPGRYSVNRTVFLAPPPYLT